jgi:hypothetical protein
MVGVGPEAVGNRQAEAKRFLRYEVPGVAGVVGHDLAADNFGHIGYQFSTATSNPKL